MKETQALYLQTALWYLAVNSARFSARRRPSEWDLRKKKWFLPFNVDLNVWTFFPALSGSVGVQWQAPSHMNRENAVIASPSLSLSLSPTLFSHNKTTGLKSLITYSLSRSQQSAAYHNNHDNYLLHVIHTKYAFLQFRGVVTIYALIIMATD